MGPRRAALWVTGILVLAAAGTLRDSGSPREATIATATVVQAIPEAATGASRAVEPAIESKAVEHARASKPIFVSETAPLPSPQELPGAIELNVSDIAQSGQLQEVLVQLADSRRGRLSEFTARFDASLLQFLSARPIADERAASESDNASDLRVDFGPNDGEIAVRSDASRVAPTAVMLRFLALGPGPALVAVTQAAAVDARGDAIALDPLPAIDVEIQSGPI